MNAAQLSVTEVRNALRCPRIFALGRLGARAAAFPVGSSGLGATFHRVVERFARTAGSPPPGCDLDGNAAQLRRNLQAWILAFLIDEVKADAALGAMSAEVDDLAEACRQFADHLALRLATTQPPRAPLLEHLIVSGEREVDALFPEANVRLKGRVDALFRSPDGQLEVVEYKLTDEANQTLDEAQVALYRAILHRSEGLDAHPVILRFTPGLSRTALAPAAADAQLQTTLIPFLQCVAGWAQAPETAPAPRCTTLCSSCPFLRACLEAYPAAFSPRDQPPVTALRPRPAAEGRPMITEPLPSVSQPEADPEGQELAVRLRQLLLESLRLQGLQIEAGTPLVGPSLVIVPVTRPRGSVSQLDRAAEDVRHRLESQHGQQVTYARRGGLREFAFTRRPARTVLLAPLLAAKAEWLAERPGRFILGQQPDGHILTGDLSDAATPHLLIGGQPGSGKSWLLRTLVASLVHHHDPSQLRLTLLDPKRVSFNDPAFLAAIAAHQEGPILYDREEALPCFEHFIQVMEERYEAFDQARVSDLHEYNATVPAQQRLHRHILVMDEFQDLTVDRKEAKLFCDKVARLGAKARAAGVHLVLATQYPVKETVPSTLKSNLGGRIALRVASAVHSRVILDEGGAESLLGRGDLLANLGHGAVRAQAAVLRI